MHQTNTFVKNTLVSHKKYHRDLFFPHFSVLFWLDWLGSCKNEQHHCSELFISPLQCLSFCLLWRVSVLKWNQDKRIGKWIKTQEWNRVTAPLRAQGYKTETQPKEESSGKGCYLAGKLAPASLERSSGCSGSTGPPRRVPGPFSLLKQRGINRSPGQRLLSPPTSPHSSQRTRVSQAIAEPITPQSTVWENCSGPAAARAQPAHGLDPLSRELTLGHGCLGSVGHGKKLMATSRMAKKATIKVSNLMKSRKSLNRWTHIESGSSFQSCFRTYSKTRLHAQLWSVELKVCHKPKVAYGMG